MTTLTGTGTAILLVYGAKLHPPRDGQPGMRCLVDERGTVLIQAIGYPTAEERDAALDLARRTCEDAGLDVQPVFNDRYLIVRRRPCSSPT